MYAVIESGGKQYRVQPGQMVVLEKLVGETGEAVEFDKVLLVADDNQVAVGRPLVEGARVTAEIVEHGRGDKVIIFKFKRRKNSRLKKGHRQDFTRVKINDVVAPQ